MYFNELTSVNEQTIGRFNRKSFSNEEVQSLFTKQKRKQIDSKDQIKCLNFLFDTVITDSTDQKIRKKNNKRN